MSEAVDIDALRQLMEKATAGNLTTAERHTESETVECPACNGDGEVEASDYCNFDDKALGVQFYGIGNEFGAHEKLWTAVMRDLPSLLTELEALRASRGRMVDMWTCFHCGETFTDRQQARLHFGRDERSEAACVIKAGAEGSLLKALRDAEYQADDAIQRMQDESTDAAKAYHAQRCRHTQALIAAEELGYERGLADGRALQPAEDCGEGSHGN